MPTLRLGSIAPDFEAETTAGPIKFHEWIGNSWAVLFSHPGDFTPVCTTELGEVARRQPDFEKRGVKVIGISANDLKSHNDWVKDINDFGAKTVGPTDVQFPIVCLPLPKMFCDIVLLKHCTDCRPRPEGIYAVRHVRRPGRHQR